MAFPLFAQNEKELPTAAESQIGLRTLEQLREGVLLDDIIDRQVYRLGPGDIVGINIVATENMVFTLRVNPAGDLFLPTIGVVTVVGLTLSDATDIIQEMVTEKLFVNAQVNVTLVDVRSYKILVYGAVINPGFVNVTSVNRVSEILDKAGGFQRYAEDKLIYVHKTDGTIKELDIREFLINGDLSQNPTMVEGEKLEVQFVPGLAGTSLDLLNLKNNRVLITGFVNRPGTHPFYPGYTIKDYIELTGGIHINGSDKGVVLTRKDENVFKGDLNQLVMPGDQVRVEPSFRYRLFGNYNIMQMITSFMSVYLSYRAATR